MIAKLSGACYARLMVHTGNINTLKLINYAYSRSIRIYGIILLL
jgi:hypothetical protein